jgi:hypothetical protein
MENFKRMEDLKVTFKNAILAQCHECMGYYADGRVDCESTQCSLYSFMPYRKLEPDLTWTKYHPRRLGRILRSEISTESRPNAGEGLRRWREAKENGTGVVE